MLADAGFAIHVDGPLYFAQSLPVQEEDNTCVVAHHGRTVYIVM